MKFSWWLLPFAVVLSLAAFAQNSGPVAHWSFDEASGSVAHDSASGIEDQITGLFKRVPGVSGSALRFEGESTMIRRSRKALPPMGSGLTVEAWLALNVYPWNWVPIVERHREEQAGYSFGVDSFGHLGLKVAVAGQWYALISKEQLPLKRWSHVAAVYTPDKGAALYINGKPSGELSLQGPLSPADDQDLVIGRAVEAVLPAQWIHPKIPVKYSIDGILDEITVYNSSLSADDIAKSFASANPPSKDVLSWPVLPSGPKGAGRFGAFYTTLKYDEVWEGPRRAAPDSDVVVRFDKAPIRMVFWQGTNYGGDWVTENNKWYTDEFLETGGPEDCPGGEDCEPMSDKQNRYSHVRILESTDARAVVHWRYGLCEVVNYVCANPDPNTGWTDWADEYFTIYPDGVAVRKAIISSSNLKHGHEFQETIVINGPGQRPEDNLQPDALTLANMNGETATISWKTPPPREVSSPSNPNVQVVNMRSEWKPFQIVSPVKSSVTLYTGEVTYSMFEWWNHWPVAQVRSSGISAVAPDRPSHSSLSHLHWEPYAQTDQTMSKIMLHGLTTKSASELVPLAKSWLHPPKAELSGQGFRSEGYDPTQRAFIIVRESGSHAARVRYQLDSSADSPIINPAFVIKNWGEREAKVSINGKPTVGGGSFRYGLVPTLEGTDLIVWLQTQSEKPITVEFAAAK
jgi:hypothetical protein